MALGDVIKTEASSEYVSYARAYPEARMIGDVVLYGQDYIEERNATYELEEYMPGWFTFGDDGGGRAMLMRLDGSAGVYSCGHGALGSAEPEVAADSFATWGDEGCPLP